MSTELRILTTPIAELEGWGLDVVTINFLDAAGIVRLYHLFGLTRADLIALPNLSAHRVNKIVTALKLFLLGEPPTCTVLPPGMIERRNDVDGANGRSLANRCPDPACWRTGLPLPPAEMFERRQSRDSSKTQRAPAD